MAERGANAAKAATSRRADQVFTRMSSSSARRFCSLRRAGERVGFASPGRVLDPGTKVAKGFLGYRRKRTATNDPIARGLGNGVFCRQSLAGGGRKTMSCSALNQPLRANLLASPLRRLP